MGKNWFGSDGSTLAKIFAEAPILGITIEKDGSGAIIICSFGPVKTLAKFEIGCCCILATGTCCCLFCVLEETVKRTPRASKTRKETS